MKRLIVILTVIYVFLSFCACTDSGNTDNTAPDTTANVTTAPVETENSTVFNVTVVDSEGNGVAGVMLQICKDTCIPKVTDENGVASFDIEVTDEHKLSVLTCPDGFVYTGDAEVYLESGMTEYTVELDAQ